MVGVDVGVDKVRHVDASPASAVGIRDRVVDLALGSAALHLFDLLVRDLVVPADPEPLQPGQGIERRDVGQAGARPLLHIGADVAHVQMPQLCQARQRPEIGAQRGLHLDILELRTEGERRRVRPVAHGEDGHLKLRHLLDEAEIGQPGIVPDVEVLDVVTVVQPLNVVRREYAADRGLGGEDHLRVGAHAVIVAEPDAEHDLDVRVGEMDLLAAPHRQLAAVQVDVFKLGHQVHDLLEQHAVVVHGDVIEVDGGIGEIAIRVVESKAVGEGKRRKGGAEGGDAVPVHFGTLRPEIDALERRKEGQRFDHVRKLRTGAAAEIRGLGAGIEHAAVRQADGPGHVDLRMPGRPCCDLPDVLTAAEIRRTESGQQIELFGLALGEHGGDVGRGDLDLPPADGDGGDGGWSRSCLGGRLRVFRRALPPAAAGGAQAQREQKQQAEQSGKPCERSLSSIHPESHPPRLSDTADRSRCRKTPDPCSR